MPSSLSFGQMKFDTSQVCGGAAAEVFCALILAPPSPMFAATTATAVIIIGY